ncbi:GrpB family protein [Nisaea sp.]|uniref:GrpB family protein n=1 Tax=Nisaea sp. TaxID=2024842 RepID=UPI003266297D
MTDQNAKQEWEVGLIGGPEKRDITQAPYNPHWAEIFASHRQVIATSIGRVARRIEHIGSTSVPGLAAKPIIDILLVVRDSGDEDVYLPALLACGYVLRVREPDFQEHRMLRTIEKDVHIHVFSDGSPEIDRYLVFRDWLRDHPSERDAYANLKQDLAKQDWDDMNAYADAKTGFIEAILKKARSIDA